MPLDKLVNKDMNSRIQISRASFPTRQKSFHVCLNGDAYLHNHRAERTGKEVKITLWSWLDYNPS
jgi:hypothetical protein